jgi:hypothetical protein
MKTCEGREGKKRIEKKWVPARESIKGIPILSKYKYLGTHLDSKLTMKNQLDFIKMKADVLLVKLYPYLTNATADGRRDMWRTMISPLFNGLLALLYTENSVSHQADTLRLWLYTFKKFMLIPKSTSTEIVEEMIGIDIFELMALNTTNSAEKWEARKNQTQPELVKRTELKNYLRGIPNGWCKILKQQCSLCHICKNSTKNAWHMETKHNIDVFSYKTVWKEIKDFYNSKMNQQKDKRNIHKPKRDIFLQYWKPLLESLEQDTSKKFNELYKDHTENLFQK